MSKINDTLSNAPSYSLPFLQTESSRVSDNYDESSTRSSPPLISAAGPPSPGFGSFQQELSMGSMTTQTAYHNMVMTTGIDYGDIAVSAPMDIFQDQADYLSSSRLKFEPDG